LAVPTLTLLSGGKVLKAVNVEVPTVGHCYPYYLVSVVIDSGEF